MKKPYSKRVLCIVGYPEKRFWIKSYWPFGKIEITKQNIIIHAFLKKYIIRVSEIKEIIIHREIREKGLYEKRNYPFLEIVHNNKKYNGLKIFLSKKEDLYKILKNY